DAVRLAVGAGAVPLPPRGPFVPPNVPTAWDRYKAGPAPVPPETAEAALWLYYRDAAIGQANRAFNTARIASALGRATVPALLDVPAAMDPRQANALYEPAWLRSADGRAARCAPLLAVRAARPARRAPPPRGAGGPTPRD